MSIHTLLQKTEKLEIQAYKKPKDLKSVECHIKLPTII